MKLTSIQFSAAGPRVDIPACQGGSRNLCRSPWRAYTVDRHTVTINLHAQLSYFPVMSILIRESREGGPLNLGTPQSTPAFKANEFTDHTKGQHSSMKETLRATLRFEC